jgi:hypothetical protein
VTLWPLPTQVHRTVSPTEMFTVSGTNWKPFPPPTITSTIVLVADGTPLTAGWPLWSTIRIGAPGAVFVWRILMRLSPDSARTKNTMANIIPSQKISRTAFDLFIFFTPFLRASVRDFLYIETKPRLTLCDSVPAILRSSVQKRQAESFAETHGTYLPSQEKGNRTVTSAARGRV